MMFQPSARSLARPVLGALIALAAIACSGASAVSVTSAPATVAPVTTAPAAAAPAQPSAPAAQPASSPAAATTNPAIARLDLTIVTGDMTGKPEYPAYIPSDFSLPANSTVVVTVTNFDDATALPANAVQYATASGVDGGTFTVTPIKAGDPNGSAGPTATKTALDPAQVSHTFTIPGLGINVPIAPHARVTFTIHTGAPGSYAWRCFDPCGAGPTGWGTAMAAKRGYMQGTLTVVA